MNQDILRVEQLSTYFGSGPDKVQAVDRVSFSLRRGCITGLVGESGCGKSATAFSLTQLLPEHISTKVEGKVWFEGKNLLELPERQMRSVRGNEISMIFQEPMTSLNPVFTVGSQIAEVLRIHKRVSRKVAKAQTIEMLKAVKIPAPEKRYKEYPHELSGGMRQRIMIAMALACSPKVLLADEPTTALDVTIQAQVLGLIREASLDHDMATLLITHDLGVVAEVCDEIVVMYAGRVVESGPVRKVFEYPQHPYTRGLLQSVPQIGRRLDKLPNIRGVVPSLKDLPKGCRFASRCDYSKDVCHATSPNMKQVRSEANHAVACFFPLGEKAEREDSLHPEFPLSFVDKNQFTQSERRH